MTSTITSLSCAELRNLLVSRALSSEEVVRAHLNRIALHTTSGFTDVRSEAALEEARRADKARARGDVVGSLCGLPVCVEDIFNVDNRSSAVITTLRATGAVVVGRTERPRGNKRLASGAVLALASEMSTLGIGTDISGSLRAGAHFAGVAALKPTLDRWSNSGSFDDPTGQELVRSQAGPVARTVDDLILFYEAMDPRLMAMGDPLVPPLPVSPIRDVDVKTLRVGFYIDDGFIHPSRAVARAVAEAKVALQGLGIDVVAFAPPSMPDAMTIYFCGLTAESTASLMVTVGLPPQLASLPIPIKELIVRALMCRGDRRLAWFLSTTGRRPLAEVRELGRRTRDYRRRFIESMRRQSIDAVLCPAHATPACRASNRSIQLELGAGASMLYNLLQFPAGVVPVTTVRENETIRDDVHDVFERAALQIDFKSRGFPVGVQLAAPPFQDERVLALMLALERALKTDSRARDLDRQTTNNATRQPEAIAVTD